MSDDFIYDIVDYPAHPLPQIAPDRISAIARLHGIDAALPRECHYLEVGCGDGATLLPLAMAYPHSRFVGMDLSSRAIARGETLRRELGLENLRLEVADLTQWAPPDDAFDYICAHGFYSWVPAHVRDALLRLCETRLTDHGVAYVSYNALPGCHIRRMIRDMLRTHVAGIKDARTRLQQAFAMLSFLDRGMIGEGIYASLIRHEIDHLRNKTPPSVLFHDDLSEINHPVSIREFTDHAGRYGLRFLGEADYFELSEDIAPEPMPQMLREMAERDVLMKEEYLDFLKVRRFRQTLLCRSGQVPRLHPDARVLDQLSIHGEMTSTPEQVDLSPGTTVVFSSRKGAGFHTDVPLSKAAALILRERFPAFTPFDALLAEARARLVGAGLAEGAEEESTLRQTLLMAFTMDMVALRCQPPGFSLEIEGKPTASALAQAQIRAGHAQVTSLRPGLVEFENHIMRELVLLLDGTRDHDALLDGLAEAMARRGETLPDSAASADATQWRHALSPILEDNLRAIARTGLLQEIATLA